MDSKESVELGLRGALIAKAALELLNGHMTAILARLHFIEMVK
jgi:hypothetical protein